MNEAVKQEKGLVEEEHFETTIDVEMDAFIPTDYIPNEAQKLDLYKRIAAIENDAESDEMLDEITDRFGDPPRSVLNLLAIAHMKGMAHAAYMTDIIERTDTIRFVMYEKAKVNPLAIPRLMELYGNTLRFTADKKAPYFEMNRKINSKAAAESSMDCIRKFIEDVQQILLEEEKKNKMLRLVSKSTIIEQAIK